MKIFLSFIILIFSLKTFAVCDFKPSVKKVISLAGPATVTLKELGLLNNPKLKGISVFNPVGKNEFSGRIYPGGIFLSQNTLNEFKDSVVFFDESRELTRIFKTYPTMVSREIKTRNQIPSETIDVTLKAVSEFITGCEEKIKSLVSKKEKLEASILSNIKKKLNVVFYLGDILNNRPPELVIVNDGVIKWLVMKEKISTYPSELAYVNWSARIMNGLPKDTLHIGIKDTEQEGLIKIKRSSRWTTLMYPGALVPGITQLEAFEYLFRNL